MARQRRFQRLAIGFLAAIGVISPQLCNAQEVKPNDRGFEKVYVAAIPDDTAANPPEGGVRDLVRNEQIPQTVNGSFVLPKLVAPTTVLNMELLTQVPKNFKDEQTIPSVPLPESYEQRTGDANAGSEEPNPWIKVQWEAPNTFSSPRYFEDRMLERHGHETLGKLQPLASGAKFFLAIPILPYLMTVSEPNEKEYSLGYYRTGSEVPMLRQRPPYERRALIAEGAVVTGGFLLLP